MRRFLITMRRFLIMSIAVISVLAIASPASAARFRAYRGETSAGTRIGFLIRVADDGRMSLQEMYIKVELLCEDASTIDYISGWGFGGVGHRLEGRRLALDLVFGPEALHVAGVFRSQTADGTYKDTQATLTDAEEAQLCTTGDLTWTADRVPRDRLPELGSRTDAAVTRHLGGRVVQRTARLR
ncbi:MAG: hypothetical protein ACXWZF_14665 [Actinomycetota bacterium]